MMPHVLGNQIPTLKQISDFYFYHIKVTVPALLKRGQSL